METNVKGAGRKYLIENFYAESGLTAELQAFQTVENKSEFQKHEKKNNADFKKWLADSKKQTLLIVDDVDSYSTVECAIKQLKQTIKQNASNLTTEQLTKLQVEITQLPVLLESTRKEAIKKAIEEKQKELEKLQSLL